MRNKFTALALILIAIVSVTNEDRTDSEEQTSEAVEANVSATFEITDVPEVSEHSVKPETSTEELTTETTISEPVTETSVTEPDDEDSELV